VIVGNDTDAPSIEFASSARGPRTDAQSLPAPLSGISFVQADSVLLVKFPEGARRRILASPHGIAAIDFDISESSAAADPAMAAAAAPSLPKLADAAEGEDGFEIVPLKYADVSEVVGLLTDGLTVKSNDSFVPREPNFGSAGMNGGAPSVTAPVPEDISNDPLGQAVDDAIAIDRRLNAVILKGSPARIARLKEKIAQIDVPVESVLLETVFVELDKSGSKNVGIDFANTNGQLAVATLQSGNFNASGFVSGRPLASISLQGALYAQVQAGHGRIVSKPRISAQSGGTAKIITGDALPILTSIALSGVNAVSQQVQYVNVGVTLQIAPRVSEDGFVTSHIFCVVSSVTGASQGYPTISQREAETSATVKDGETFVIGGLTEESNIVSDTKVPLLGDAPLVGDLFRLGTGARSKTDLYIVVTPHIVRRGAAYGGLPAEVEP